MSVEVLLAGTLSTQGIIRAQGGAPRNWFVFRNPAAFVAFFIFFTSQLAEANRTPFDLAEAEQELHKIPFFVRGKARRNTERFAQERNLGLITLETLYDAKAHFGR